MDLVICKVAFHIPKGSHYVLKYFRYESPRVQADGQVSPSIVPRKWAIGSFVQILSGESEITDLDEQVHGVNRLNSLC